MLHKLANTTARRLRRQRFSQARYEGAVDRLVAAYFAALDREERAAAEYAACVEQVCALVSADGGLLATAGAGTGSAPESPRRPKERL
jgi:hypothetical protein